MMRQRPSSPKPNAPYQQALVSQGNVSRAKAKSVSSTSRRPAPSKARSGSLVRGASPRLPLSEDTRSLVAARQSSKVGRVVGKDIEQKILRNGVDEQQHEGELVLSRIRAAQDAGLSKHGPDGKPRRSNPPFCIARDEIREGSKRSHWIWYVWPSLRAVRSSMHPELLLPDFCAACMYLQDRTLGARLVEVSELANRHLEGGLDPAILFGKMHHCDFPKFYEAMSLFAIAAHVNGNADQEAVFLAGVRACGTDRLDENTTAELLRETNPHIAVAVQEVAAALA